MTDDLVERLRRTYRKEFPVTGSMIADNSNRLRPFPILATEVLFNPDGREAADRIEALEAENERLREALAHIAFSGVDGPYGEFGEALNEHQMRRVARAALQEQSK